jgi:ferredoxin
MAGQEKPHSMNTAGPFYVVDGCCTACGVPEATAPEMFAYDSATHCYVRRQPMSDDEVERALQVIRGQELGCVRYRGADPAILRRLAEAGESAACDYPAIGVEPILRNVVRFVLNREASISLDAFVEYQRNLVPGLRISTRRVAGATLSYSWFENNFHELVLSGLDERARRWMIRHNGPLGISEWLHRWLRTMPDVADIRWVTEQEQHQGAPGQRAPW